MNSQEPARFIFNSVDLGELLVMEMHREPIVVLSAKPGYERVAALGGPLSPWQTERTIVGTERRLEVLFRPGRDLDLALRFDGLDWRMILERDRLLCRLVLDVGSGWTLRAEGADGQNLSLTRSPQP